MGKTWSNRKAVKKDAFKMKGPKLVKSSKPNPFKGPKLPKQYADWND